ncbi:hypothetical protein GA0070616_0169 [Micromonospora nigra]|uniref:RNA polymerase sigma-70 factor, ECF subfamily n=1 Tax=Micromonospora nigra TaxID=145857 RepID=A0A1C6R8W2_9ACTN|nr:hypothetical protein [Micromonospora nigra]SCL13527.1 hypothetical protein GA0070616_0169 [Micromonospora nigra]
MLTTDGPFALRPPAHPPGYQPYHVVRAELLTRAGRAAEAGAAYDAALALTTNDVAREHLLRRRAGVRDPVG